MFSYKNKKHKGFTLIELLVVIAIISLLVTMAITSLKNAREKARDAKRISDIKQLVTAIKLVADDNGGQYPSSSGGQARCLGIPSGQTCWLGNISGSDSLNTALSQYINIPSDPLNGSRNKGDVYLYVDESGNTAWHCNGTAYPTGPFLFWVPENTNPHSDSDDCQNMGFYACCGATTCGEGYYCAYKIE